MSEREDRTVVIFERVDEAITALRAIRRLAQKGERVDESRFAALRETVVSLQHHCEMQASER